MPRRTAGLAPLPLLLLTACQPAAEPASPAPAPAPVSAASPATAPAASPTPAPAAPAPKAEVAKAEAPKPEPPKAPSPPPAPKTVTSSFALAKVMDLAALPADAKAKYTRKSSATVEVHVPGKTLEVADAYRKTLRDRGWAEVADADARNTEEYVSFRFAKDGHALSGSVSPYPEADEKGPWALVTLNAHGNLDTRSLPTPAGKQDQSLGQTVSSYLVTDNLDATVAWVQKTLGAEGWQPFTAAVAGPDTPEFRTLMLRKDAYALTVYVSVHPVHKKTHLQYAVAALAHELPTPPGATKVAFDDDRWLLECEAPGDFKAAGAFYQKAMPALGYTPLPGEEPTPTYWNLRFGTPAGDVVMVQAATKDGAPTKVRLRGVPASVMAKIKEQSGKAGEKAPE